MCVPASFFAIRLMLEGRSWIGIHGQGESWKIAAVKL